MEADPGRVALLLLALLAALASSCDDGADPFPPAAAPPQAPVSSPAAPTPTRLEPAMRPEAGDATAGLRWAWLQLEGVAVLVPSGAQPGHGSPWTVEHFADPCRDGAPYTIVRVHTDAVILRFDWPEARFRVLGQPPTHDETEAVVHMLRSVQGAWEGDVPEPGAQPDVCAAWDGFGPPPG